MGVFKTYDVRGVWGEGIDPRTTYLIGRAFARQMGGRRYMVGYDARLHSLLMYERVTQGLVDEGKEVVGVGLASTPLLHYAQITGGYDAGLMVTASHNPPEYQGIKLYDATGGSVSYAKGLDRIEKAVSEMSEDEAVVPGGSSREVDALAGYVDFVAAALQGVAPASKVVVDISSGSAGRVFERFAERVGADILLMNEKPDGRFPVHGPNPLEEESIRGLSRRVVETGADFGVILDGDGDRLLFVDEKGRRVDNYFLSALIAEELLRSDLEGAIVYDLISSRVLPERISQAGGKPVISRVGYTFLYDQMVQTGALFGSETSGHVYFKVTDTYYTESAAYALAVVLRLMARADSPLSTYIDPMRSRFSQLPETNFEVRDKEAALAAIERRYADAGIDRLDGISVSYDDFWFNLRPSNTEPVLRLRLEALDAETAQRAAREIRGIVTS